MSLSSPLVVLSRDIRWGNIKDVNMTILISFEQKVIEKGSHFQSPMCPFLSPFMTCSGKWRQVSELKVYTLILVDTDFVLIKIKVCCLQNLQ